MKKALLVDDDYLVRSYLKMLPSWQKAGVEIEADVRDGEEALERLEQGGIDLVVTDIAMPLMDGIELIREIRKRYQGIYVIVLSCHDEFEYVKKAMQEGADEYVLKNTLNEESLYKLLAETLEKITAQEKNAACSKEETENREDAREDKQEASDQIPNVGNQKFLFFNQVLSGILTGEEREKKRIDAGIRGKYQNSAVIVMKLDEVEDAEDPWEDIRREQYCLDFLQRFCQELHREERESETEKEVIYLGRGVFCCFVDLSEMHKNSVMYQKLMNVASATYKICRQETQTFKIGVSNIGIGSEALRQGYQQARMMIKVGFYENDQMVYYDPQKTVSKKLPEEAQELLEQWEKFRYGEQTDAFLQMSMRAVQAFKEQMTDSVVVLQWLRKLEHAILPEESIHFSMISNIRDVSEAVGQIAEKISEKEKPEIPQNISKTVRMAVEYVTVHYKESIGLNDVAEAAGVNSTYLSYLFSQEMGIGFSNYLLNLRIQCAKKLLEESSLKIRQVAEKSGFNDYHYFSKVFKKMTGVSAAQYRKDHTE